MSPVTFALERVALFTAHRDREQLDLALAETLVSLLSLESLQVVKLVGPLDDLRWLVRAGVDAPGNAPRIPTDLPEFDELPRRDDDPPRAAAILDDAHVEARIDGQCLTVFPVFIDGKAEGVVELRTRRRLSEALLRQARALIATYRNFLGLLNYGEIDPLTGLMNRRSFDQTFLRQIAPLRKLEAEPQVSEERRAPVAPNALWLGILDIDHFKRVNDRFGHLIGDEVLLLVARLVRTTLRLHDLVYRFGGEEFVIMLRCAEEAHALSAFERVRRRIESHAFPQVGQVTASIGITEVRSNDSPASAFERADRAVYFAKDQGRNQVVSHGQLISQGLILDDDKTGDVELF